MPKHVGSDPLGEASHPTCDVVRSLDGCLVEMVAPPLASLAVAVDAGCWKDPLPWPGAPGGRVLRAERVWHRHPPGADAEVTLVLGFDVLEVRSKRWDQLGRQGRSTVLSPLSVAHDNAALLEAHVFDSDHGRLQQPKAAAVHHRYQQAYGLIQCGDDLADLGPR